MKNVFQTIGVVLGLVTGILVSSLTYLPKSDVFATPHVTITIARVESRRWNLRYELDRPVTVLIFEQQMHRFRVGKWKPVGDEWVLDEASGKEGVRRKDGKSFQSVSVQFGPEGGRFYDLYAFSLPFSDGGYAFYSGHFLVHGGWETKFRLIPYPGERVDVVGASSKTELVWKSPRRLDEYGAFLYFGKTPTVETRYFDALIDPGLPDWLRKRVFETLPEALAYLERETKVVLDKRTFVMVNRWPEPIDQQRFMGTASDRWISVDLQGAEWKTPSAGAEEKFFGLIAHEASHLYTSQSRNDFLRIAWMNEGGADYFSALISRELSVITEKRFGERLSQALDDCLKFRAAGSPRLNAPDKHGNTGYYYQCGMAVHAAMSRILADAEPPRSFFEFWGVLVSESRASASVYSEAEYFALARRWSKSPDVEFLERFVSAPPVDAREDDLRLRKIIFGRVNLPLGPGRNN